MKKISAEIIADSVNPQGDRITSFILTYPRFIHSELMTHRMFSRNSASSRAIPFKTMVKSVEQDPFIPIAWQQDHKGMQGSKYIIDPDRINKCKGNWLCAAYAATMWAEILNKGFGDDKLGDGTNTDQVTKQLCNRVLEPYMWHTVLVTATEYDNFFELRCPKYYYEPENKYFRSKKDYSAYWFDCFGSGIEEVIEGDPVLWWLNRNHSQAEIHIQALAEAMWDARNESTPNKLEIGEWHIPFGDKIVRKMSMKDDDYFNRFSVQIATARCARLSYMTFDGEIDYDKDIALHDTLIANGHLSPFEHCAKAMNDYEYYSFVKGRVPTREDQDCVFNYEYYPFVKDQYWDQFDLKKYQWIDFEGKNPKNGNRYGWCDNFKGFIPYRYIIENDIV